MLALGLNPHFSPIVVARREDVVRIDLVERQWLVQPAESVVETASVRSGDDHSFGLSRRQVMALRQLVVWPVSGVAKRPAAGRLALDIGCTHQLSSQKP